MQPLLSATTAAIQRKVPVMAKVMERSISKAFKEIIEDHGFTNTGDNVKFEKKSSLKSVSLKVQETFPGELSIRIRTTNKVTGKKSETLFHHVSSASTIRDIAESLSF